MNSLTIKQTLIKSIIGYLIFVVTLLIFDFYVAQNILTAIGAIYISLAWVKYLLKDNFLKSNKFSNSSEQKTTYSSTIVSYLIAGLLCLIIAVF